LTLLAGRPSNGGGKPLDLVHVGRLVLCAAAGIGHSGRRRRRSQFGNDQESLQAGCARPKARILSDQALIDVLVVAVPPAWAVFSYITKLAQSLRAARS